MSDTLFLQVLGGVFLLLYGVRLTGQGFELAFGAGLKALWGAPGGHLRAFGAGVAGTALLQSSGAVVALLISFAEIAPLPLAQSLYAVLGADLGSTLIVQVLSFRIHQAAFPVLMVGVILYLWGRKGKARSVGQGILGFGFILLSLKLLSSAAADVGRIESLRLLMADFGRAPLVAFFWGVVLSALFQSGTALVVILIAFTQQGVLPAHAAFPLVLGANVGGTSVAFVAASGLAAEGKRVAWGHMLMKTAGAIVFLGIFYLAGHFGLKFMGDPSREVANAHTVFNAALAALFFPLVPRFSVVLSRSIPDRKDRAPRWRPVFLDKDHLPVAGAALGQAAREIVRVADMIQEMHGLAQQALKTGGEELPDRIARMDDDVDQLTREVKAFLSELGQGALDPEQTRTAVAYISVVSDLENIGDFIDKTLGDHVRRLARNQQRFSDEGKKELDSFLAEVGSLYRDAVAVFVTRDAKIAQSIINRKKAVGQTERTLRLAHIRRLQKGTPESLETSAAHLDILSAWKVIAAHCASIAHNVLEMEG
ncbi:MAG: Na/Pi cotransporter family protein [Deltaproteobacteria bacterium]|nr:Na/Pi cotransporter family protein [Deltaproteobacteria bacterium]